MNTLMLTSDDLDLPFPPPPGQLQQPFLTDRRLRHPSSRGDRGELPRRHRIGSHKPPSHPNRAGQQISRYPVRPVNRIRNVASVHQDIEHIHRRRFKRREHPEWQMALPSGIDRDPS